MIKKSEINTEAIIKRAKIYLNISSDSKLSTFLGKSENYISLIKSQKRVIDLYALLEVCVDADLNWLLTGNSEKNRLIAELDDQTGRKIIDLNADFEILKKENNNLKEEILLFKNILKDKININKTNKSDE